MRVIALLFFCLFCASAQIITNPSSGGGGGAVNVTTLPATCSPTTRPNLVFLTTAYSSFSVGLYQCTSTNTWSYLGAAGYGNLSCTYASTVGCTINTSTLGATTVDQILVQCYTVSGTTQTPATISNYTSTVTSGIVTQVAVTTGSSGTGYCVANANGAALPSNAVITVNAHPGPNVTLTKVDVGLNNVQNLDQTNATNIASGQVNVPTSNVVYASDSSGSPTTYTATGVPAPISYQTSMLVTLVPQTTNTTSTPTLSLNGLGNKNLKASATSALTIGELVAGLPYAFTYDGTEFVLAGGAGTSTGSGFIATGTSALGTSSISSTGCATVVTTTATGTQSCDAISFTPNVDISAVTGYAPSINGGLIVYPYPSANAVNFKVCNPTSSSIVPGAVTLNWVVNGPTSCGLISPSSAGPYTATQTVSSPTFTCVGCAAATWSINGAGASAGLSINSSTGVMGGTAGSAASYGGVVVSYGSNSTPPFTVVINGAPTVTTASLNTGTTGQTNYSQTLTESGGVGPFTWSNTGTAFPSNLGITGAVLSGTNLTGTTTSGIVLHVLDANGVAASSGSLTLTVNAAPAVGTCGGTGPPACPGATNGSAYSQAITVTGGTGTVTLNVTSGALPGGVVIAGHTLTSANVTASAGTYNFQITPQDANLVNGTPVAYSIVVSGGGGGPITLDNTSSASGQATGTLLTWTHTVTGNTHFAVVVGVTYGSLGPTTTPPSSVTACGLSLTLATSTFALAGTPETNALYYGVGSVSTGSCTINVNFPSTQTAYGWAISLNGVNQVTPKDVDAVVTHTYAGLAYFSYGFTTTSNNEWTVNIVGLNGNCTNLATNNSTPIGACMNAFAGTWMSYSGPLSTGANNVAWQGDGTNQAGVVILTFIPG